MEAGASRRRTPREWRPEPALAGFVDAYWAQQAESARPARILPDGCVDLIFDFRGTACAAWVVGSMTRPLELGARGNVDAVAIRFTPGGAHALLGLPTQELADRRERWSKALGHRSELAGVDLPWLRGERDDPGVRDVGQRLLRVERWLLALAERVPAERRAVARVARACFDAPEHTVGELASSLGRSRQHLRRQVLRATGLSPKVLQRVGRFQRALTAMRAGVRPDAALASRVGYFDQSHLAAEFRQLAADSPTTVFEREVPFFQDARPGAT